MDMSLIQGTISGLKIAGDIAKGFLELKSIADVQEKVIELRAQFCPHKAALSLPMLIKRRWLTRYANLKKKSHA